MKFEGRVWKDGAHWLISVPILDVMTQGTSKADAYEMIADAIESLVGKAAFKVTVHSKRGSEFAISANDTGVLIALLLERQRAAHGLTLQEMAKRLGINSPNAYARYERGTSIPSIDKLSELLEAIDPELSPILKVG